MCLNKEAGNQNWDGDVHNIIDLFMKVGNRKNRGREGLAGL